MTGWIVLLTLCCSTAAHALTLPVREHPFLLADSATISHAKWKSQNYLWAHNAYNTIQSNATKALSNLNIPDEPGSSTHEVFWRRVGLLGQAYVLTGYEVYAQGARTILMQYADVYPVWGYAITNLLAACEGGVEAIWGYDLIYNSPCLSAADRNHIETNFFRKLADRVKTSVLENNHQTWHNALLTGVGLVLEDPDLVELAFEGKRGLRWQFRNFILSDGWWAETTPGYHLFALDAMRYTVEAADRAGFSFADHPAYKAMFDAPLSALLPDNTLPAINDTAALFNISERRYFYERAYSRFGDPAYLTVLNLGPREGIDALLFGADSLPAALPLDRMSTVCRGAGLAVLRHGTGDQAMSLHLDYGPHGMWHGHRDKLAIILYAQGRVLSPDPSLYWRDMNLDTDEWRYFYRQTFAHNTVSVDLVKQKAAEGELTLFYADEDFSLVQAQCCRNAYPDVLLRRTLAMTDHYVIDVFEVRGSQKHTYDWVYHNEGIPSSDLALSARGKPIGYSDGYEFMTNISEATADGTFRIDFTQPQANVRITMLGAEGTRLFLGTSQVAATSWPTAVVRRHTDRTVFISVIEPYGQMPRVTGVSHLPIRGSGGAYALEIACAGDRKDRFLLAETGGIERRLDETLTTGRACYVRTQSGIVTQEHHVN